MEYIALALSLVAVILCIVILTKVNKLLTMLRTPIFKKLTPDMNLKPASRRPISAQEMAQRGERKENRQNNNGKDRPAKENRDNRAADKQQQQPARDRNEQRDRNNNRRDRRDRREGRREQNVEAQNVAAEAQAPAAAAPAVEAAPAAAPEARRPLARGRGAERALLRMGVVGADAERDRLPGEAGAHMRGPLPLQPRPPQGWPHQGGAEAAVRG